MVDIDRSSLDEASRPKRGGFLQSIGGPQFLTAQFFTIAATILGVYLAGYVGFQRTLQYDRLIKAEQQADLLKAMQAELTDNTTRLRAFFDKLDPSGAKSVYEWPQLRLFVWNAAGRTPAVFETPPQTLAGMQSFYDEMNRLLTNDKAHEWFRRSVSTFAYDRTQFKKRMDEQLVFAEETLLPSIRSAASASETEASKIAGADQ